MIRVEPAPDVSVRAHGGAGKQQGTGDDLFAALLAMISGVTTPMSLLTTPTDGRPATAAADPAEALPVTGATLAAALGAIDTRAIDPKALGKDTDGKAADAPTGAPADATSAGKATALPPGLAPTGHARAETPAGDRSKALDHTAAADHANAATPKPDAPVPAPNAAHRPDQLPDTAGAPAVAATSAAQSADGARPGDGPAPTTYVSELPAAITDAVARLRPHGGGLRLSVRLDPPNVGTVMLSLHVVDDHVRLVMHAPDGTGAEALHQQKHLVEAALSAEGLALEEFRVDVGGGQTGTPADASPQGQGERARSPRGSEQAGPLTSIEVPVRSQRTLPGVWL